jgi:serine/threonine protein kinase
VEATGLAALSGETPTMIGRRLGPYEVVAKLGEGGMGEVYKGQNTRLGRDVALKVLPTALAADPEFRERFDREARIGIEICQELESPRALPGSDRAGGRV